MWMAKKDIVWRSKDDMLVLLNTTTGHYYTVNQTGAVLWRNLVEHKMSFDDAVERLYGQCEGSPDKSVVGQDCSRLIEEWKSENLIEEAVAAKPA
jgi:hypothetical protein